MDKTVVVEIQRRKMHRVYKKVVGSSKRVMAHDETNTIPVGSVVRIIESKPLSKNKRWVVEEVVEAVDIIDDAPVAEVAAPEQETEA
jgi:small subunit ribosomal protein S17